MKKTVLFFFISLPINLFSQSHLPNNFSIGNFIEIFAKDSLKIFFNCKGRITDKTCADFYRVGKLDSTIINFTGLIYDYTVNGNLALKGRTQNNNLEGSAEYFYENGYKKEEGQYHANNRVGNWTFYYPNGQIEKILNYDTGESLLLEAYESNGKATVTKGNGKTKIKFSGTNQCTPFIAEGVVLNGKKHGKWTFSNLNAGQSIATEHYKEGAFVKGESNGVIYYNNQRITFDRFYANESLDLTENFLGCPGDYGIFPWEYRNTPIINKSFFPDVIKAMNKKNLAQVDQWLIVGIHLGKKNNIEKINIGSSIDDTYLEKEIYSILIKMNDWKSAKINSQSIESHIFFPILITNKTIIIPTEYFFRNRS